MASCYRSYVKFSLNLNSAIVKEQRITTKDGQFYHHTCIPPAKRWYKCIIIRVCIIEGHSKTISWIPCHLSRQRRRTLVYLFFTLLLPRRYGVNLGIGGKMTTKKCFLFYRNVIEVVIEWKINCKRNQGGPKNQCIIFIGHKDM